MSNQKRIDKILEEARERAQTEVGALVGAPFSFTSLEKTPVTKEEVFEDLSGSHICAHIDIDGEAEGKSCFLIKVKDAIMLGGTLIMLPEGELEETVSQENYTEDIEDSFGEIANIIAGSYTKVFEDNYPKSCRFIRKEQEVIKPGKIDTSSDELIANQMYYRASAKMELNGNALGNLTILLPADTFELSWEDTTSDKPLSDAQPVQAEAVKAAEPSPAKPPEVDNNSKPPVDSKKQQKLVDKIVNEISDRAPEEIGGLLGVSFKFSGLGCKFVTKEECFEDLTGPQVCAHIDIDGEVSGKSCMLLGLKGAISLGGTLIMLPEAELDEHINQENYTEDLEDSYGEIANILMGVYTKVFEDNYPKSCRLIRKEQEVVKPAKVDPDNDDLIINQLYYQVCHTLELNGTEIGKLVVLLPAASFGLSNDTGVTEAAQPAPVATQEPVSTPVEQPVVESPTRSVASVPSFDPEKNRKKVDTILSECFDTVGGELSALLGVEVKVTDLNNDFVNKEDFFLDHVEGKQVVADLEMEGGLEGKSYLVASIKDAIYTGGVLVMLPPSELDVVVQQEDFDEDAKDAYGEISNIIAGIYSKAFEEDHEKKVRMIRRNMSEIAPGKVDVESEEPILNQQYYLSSMGLSIDDVALGRLQLLLPADSFELVLQEGQAAVGQADQAPVVTSPQTSQPIPASPSTAYDILIVSNSPGDSQKLKETFDAKGYVVGVIGFGDNVYDYIPGQLKAIYLVMNEVNEQAFGVAIKLNAGAKVPLIAAGPAWTRTKVIQAVKYGVSDILMTPAEAVDIDENINKNIVALAA